MAAFNKPGFSVDTHYHSVPNSADNDSTKPETDSLRPKLELGAHPQVQSKRKWLPTLGIQFFFLLWCVPIMALLVLNFKSWIIGASACKFFNWRR